LHAKDGGKPMRQRLRSSNKGVILVTAFHRLCECTAA